MYLTRAKYVMNIHGLHEGRRQKTVHDVGSPMKNKKLSAVQCVRSLISELDLFIPALEFKVLFFFVMTVQL